MHIEEKYMKLAIKEARKAKSLGDLPFGAVVVCKDRVAGIGKAQDNTTGIVTDHAELLAVQEACRKLGTNKLDSCVIYCTNEPCIMCAAVIFQARIGQIVIGASRSDLPEILRQRKIGITDLANDSSYNINIYRGILKKEVLELFIDIKI